MADKLRIVAESEAPGSGVNIVAARYDIGASLVSTWRGQVRDGILRPAGSRCFVAVRLPASAEPFEVAERAGASKAAAAIEIALPDGIRLYISHAAQLPLLRDVLAAVRT